MKDDRLSRVIDLLQQAGIDVPDDTDEEDLIDAILAAGLSDDDADDDDFDDDDQDAGDYGDVRPADRRISMSLTAADRRTLAALRHHWNLPRRRR